MKTHLILSGGGINGIQMVGALKALHEHNQLEDLKLIAGVSIGAMIGALLCCITIEDIETIIPKILVMPIMNLKTFLQKFGICSKQYYLNILNEYIKNATFIDLYKLSNKQLDIYATNLTTSQLELFNYTNSPDLKVIDAISFSMNIPFVFECEQYNNSFYVDGAIINNFPIEFYDNIPNENKIGIVLSHTFRNDITIQNVFQYLFKIFHSFIQSKKKEYPEYVITVKCSLHNMLNFKLNQDQIQTMILEGYNIVLKILLL